MSEVSLEWIENTAKHLRTNQSAMEQRRHQVNEFSL